MLLLKVQSSNNAGRSSFMQMLERIGFQCHVSPLYGPECQMVKINCLTLHFNLARVMLTARAARARPRQPRTWQMF